MASKTSIYENIIYASIWIAAFVFSFTVVGDEIISGDTTKWADVLKALKKMIPFMVSFLIHAYILVPLLLDRRKHVLYVIALLLLVFSFTVNSQIETNRMRQEWYKAMVEMRQNDTLHKKPPQKLRPNIPPPMPELDKSQIRQLKIRQFFVSPTFLDIVLLLLLLSVNLGVRYCFSRNEHQKRMSALEQEVTRTELENLKSQVSPHFIMNVLNNIHGLIEMDTQRAQEMVLKLSKMMRYVLYDCSSAKIGLVKEVGFINNYVLLMKDRYPADKLKINLDLPDAGSCGNYDIAPLIFVVFIENAFKHGISFTDVDNLPFIDVSVKINSDKLRFVCKNINYSKGDTGRIPGIGLKNIKRRLDVIYEHNYHLTIDNQSDIYCVDLIIPLNYDYQMSGNR